MYEIKKILLNCNVFNLPKWAYKIELIINHN
jgi:hypothetical protein